MAKTLLVVDDEAAARFALVRAFRPVYQVREAASVEEARQQIRDADPGVILLDYTMPEEDGMVLLKELSEAGDTRGVIMLTAYGSERIAVEAMKSGAYDYLSKPYDLEELRLVVARAFEHQELRREVADLRERLSGQCQFGRMVGDSPVMREVFEAAARVAETDLPVLILGESGAGKDVLAQEVHARSLRAANRMVALNCAALPETLVESELFGSEKGAYTGASASRPGKFELAHRGTLFLDEIGDMTPATQAKILRAAETGTIERLGATQPLRVDVRIIAATNQNLQAAIREGKFRQDLYFRLAGMTLYLPPLRQRREDIPLLVERFWGDLQRKYKRDGPLLTTEAMMKLSQHDWPGNVRQLRSAVERLFVLARGDRVAGSDMDMVLEPMAAAGSAAREPYFDAPDFREARRLFEIEYLARKLRENGGNVTRTAAAIGLERQSLQEKIRQLNIPRD
jgi:DNA-binding NtrC family response regulator